MPLSNSTLTRIDQRTKDDSDFAAAAEAEFQAMRIEQEFVALRTASGLSKRQLAAKLGVKQPVIAKLEAGKTRNIGLQTFCARRQGDERPYRSINHSEGAP